MSDKKLQIYGFVLVVFVAASSILYAYHEVKRIENIHRKEFRILHFKQPEGGLR